MQENLFGHFGVHDDACNIAVGDNRGTTLRGKVCQHIVSGVFRRHGDDLRSVFQLPHGGTETVGLALANLRALKSHIIGQECVLHLSIDGSRQLFRTNLLHLGQDGLLRRGIGHLALGKGEGHYGILLVATTPLFVQHLDGL